MWPNERNEVRFNARNAMQRNVMLRNAICEKNWMQCMHGIENDYSSGVVVSHLQRRRRKCFLVLVIKQI